MTQARARSLDYIPQLDAAINLADTVAPTLNIKPPGRRDVHDMERCILELRTAAMDRIGTDNDTADLAISTAAAVRLAIDFIHLAKLSSEHPDPSWRAYYDERATHCERGSDEAIRHATDLMEGAAA